MSILLEDEEIGQLVTEGLMTVHSYMAIGQMVAKAQLKRVVEIYEEQNPSLYKKYPHFWQALIKEVE